MNPNRFLYLAIVCIRNAESRKIDGRVIANLPPTISYPCSF